MANPAVYVGKDLEAMSFAVNYHKWILKEFMPFIGQDIVEVGAGTGSFSELLLDLKPASLSLVEPSGMFEHLTRIQKQAGATELFFYHSIFLTASREIMEVSRPDTVIYVNVLEHIDDDRGELSAVFETLEVGGNCLIFVPALQSLYGDFDRKVGHFRRASKRDLETKCTAAGFEIVRSTFFDFAGVLPWFVKYRILKSDSLGAAGVKLYDSLVIPIMSRIEPWFGVPIGKNLLIVVRKKSYGSMPLL